MNWMEEFIGQCLSGVPEGKYRRRTELELRDHLLALSQDLEQAGHTQLEARTLALSRMGDPVELARSYLREWKRRSLWQRWLAAAGLVLFVPCIMATGYLYIFNARNFGKSLVAYWGIAAILAAGVLLWSLHGFVTKNWTAAHLACGVLAVIQVPPLQCWLFYFGSVFEFFGVMVPGWLGLSVHLLFLLWAGGNLWLLDRFQREDSSVKEGQTAS